MPLLAQPVGTKTYVEDVGGGRQREMHPIDDEGEGGQVLDVITVHKKLQREEQDPGGLIAHPRVATNSSPQPLWPQAEPQACFWTEVAPLKESPV